MKLHSQGTQGGVTEIQWHFKDIIISHNMCIILLLRKTIDKAEMVMLYFLSSAIAALEFTVILCRIAWTGVSKLRLHRVHPNFSTPPTIHA